MGLYPARWVLVVMQTFGSWFLNAPLAKSRFLPRSITALVSSCALKDGTPTSKTFEHVTSEIGAEEAEEVGVEHLLR